MHSSNDWLKATWATADRHAHRLACLLAGQAGGLVVLPGRQRRLPDSGFVIASLLQRTTKVPALVLGAAPTLVEARRRAIAERLPKASIAVLDWCHPAPAAPVEVTMLGGQCLARAQATISGYEAATIAVLSGVTSWHERDLTALRAVMDAAPNPLIVVEEWADPGVIAAAAARVAGIPLPDAQSAVQRWLAACSRRRATHTGPWSDPALGLLQACSQTESLAA
jgi:hypothetical protein